MDGAQRIRLELRLGDLEPSDLDVTDVEGREGLSEPYAFLVSFTRRSGEAVDLPSLVGEPAVLGIARPGGEERWVHGEATRVELTGVAAGVPSYRVRIEPRLARLRCIARRRIFQGKSVPEIAEAVLSEHDVPHRSSLSGSYPAREYTVQHGESDLAFVSRLLEAEGIWYRFEHGESSHELVLADAGSACVECAEPLPYRPATDQGDGTEHVFELARIRRVVPTAAARRDFDPVRPTLDLSARAGEDGLEVYEWPGGYREQREGQRLAAARLEDLRFGDETLQGKGNCLAVAPGTAFEVESHADGAMNGKLLAVRLEHRARRQGAAGGPGGIAASYEHAFVAIRADRPYRPRRSTPAPRLPGIQTATVVGPAGEEIHTDEHGRIKVQFHWDREGARDERSSCWVRVSQAWAGASMGASFVPRIGQEVVVRFLEGNADEPLVVGAVYNGRNAPPIALPGDKTRTTLRTDTSPGSGGSNELRLEDLAGAEEVYLHAQRDHAVEVGNDERHQVNVGEVLEVAKDRSRRVMGAQELEVAGRDGSTVGGNASAVVAGTRTVTVAGKHNEQVVGSSGVTVGGARNVTVAAASAELIGAAAALSVGLGYATTVGGALNHAVAGAKMTEVAGAAVEVVGAARTETVAGQRSARTQGDEKAQVDGRVRRSTDRDAKEEVGADHRLDVTGADQVGAQSALYQAEKLLQIVVNGKVALSFTSSGLEIAGANVTIEGE